MTNIKAHFTSIVAVLLLCVAGATSGVELNPASVEFKMPAEIKWVRNTAGANEQAVLFGDPDKRDCMWYTSSGCPAISAARIFITRTAFFVVISGTWWVGTGNRFNSDETVAIAAGSYVIHKAGQLNYDGTKNAEAII